MNRSLSQSSSGMSRFEDSLQVRNGIEELLRITGHEDSLHKAESLTRLLRPCTHDMHEFTNALKQRIKRSILTRPGGPLIVAKFEKACDGFAKLEGKNKNVLPSFLAIFAPLAFSPLSCSPSIRGTSLPPTGVAQSMADTSELRSVMSSSQARFPPPVPTDADSSSLAAAIRASSQLVGSQSQQPRDRSVRPPLVSDRVVPPPSTLPHFDPEEYEDDSAAVLAYREVLDSMWLSAATELALIRDLLFVFQGIAGKHIKYDPRSEAYVIDPALSLKSIAKDTVLTLCELGWLFGKVDAYVRRAESDKYRGLVTHAFGFALQEELHDYYRLLAVLEQELGRRLKALSDPSKSQQQGSAGLTLLRLRAWVQEPMDRMYLMARLVDSAAPLTGGALASRLFGHSKHGDPAVRMFVTRLMTSVCAPLYAMLTRWLLHGELQDPHREFFIAQGSQQAQADNAWHQLYALNYAMLPTFISTELAARVLVVGKSISFLRICVQNLSRQPEEKEVRAQAKDRGEKMSRESVSNALRGTDSSTAIVLTTAAVNSADTSLLMDELFSKSDELSRCLQGLLDLEGNQRLSALMDSISGSVDGRLLNVMESRYYLSTHLSSLKKFMLLGQGDFVTCLMDALGPELKKKASLLYRHNLTGMLEGALRASNAQFEPSFVLERVGVRLLEASAGDTGWEVFALDYIVDAPLSAVVHADAMRKYRSAFFTLWKLKRLEWSLSASWKHLMAFNHMRGSVVVPKLGATLHHCSLSRAFMTHVINNFCAFMQFEVIESAWSTFQSALAQATCLDAVVRAHDAYLADIHKRALLDPVHEALNVQVQLMLQSMLRFCSLEESLVADAIATVSRRRALITDIKARAKGRRSHYVDEEDYDVDDTPSKAEGMTGFLIQKLDEAVKDFRANFDKIMSMLREQGDRAEEISRFLTFRLDYNDYYARTADGGKMDSTAAATPATRMKSSLSRQSLSLSTR